jgi:hypothetical protein
MFGPKSAADRTSKAKPGSKVKLRARVVGKLPLLQNTAVQGCWESLPLLLDYLDLLAATTGIHPVIARYRNS